MITCAMCGKRVEMACSTHADVLGCRKKHRPISAELPNRDYGLIEGTGTTAGPQIFGSVTDDGVSEFAGQLSDLSDTAIGVVNGLKYDRAILRKAMADALSELDASEFTNAEHSRAKDILRKHSF